MFCVIQDKNYNEIVFGTMSLYICLGDRNENI